MRLLDRFIEAYKQETKKTLAQFINGFYCHYIIACENRDYKPLSMVEWLCSRRVS